MIAGKRAFLGTTAAALAALAVASASAQSRPTQANPALSATAKSPVNHSAPTPACALPSGSKFSWVTYLETTAQADDPRCSPGTPFGRSCKVKLMGALFEPPGGGKHPLVIYNHGSGNGNSSSGATGNKAWARGDETCYLAKIFLERGYTFFEPYRRGHGPSTGVWAVDVLNQVKDIDPKVSDQLIAPLLARQTEDVRAALDYAKAHVQSADTSKLAVMGHSYGGMVTLFTAEEVDGFRAAVALAPGGLSWGDNDGLQRALGRAAKSTKYPTFVAQSDEECSRSDPAATLTPWVKLGGGDGKVYDWDPPRQRLPDKPCRVVHSRFLRECSGQRLWVDDVMAFLKRHGVAPQGTGTAFACTP